MFSAEQLLFDIVCIWTDMEYDVFHRITDTKVDQAHQVGFNGIPCKFEILCSYF